MARILTSPIWTISKEELDLIVKESLSLSDVMRKLGFKSCSSGNARRVKVRLENENISTDHFEPFKRTTHTPSIPLEKILIENSTYLNITRLKIRLFKGKLLKNSCYICNQDQIWNGKPLIFILDHINGIHNDHRIENLRLVCGNCNSQLETHAGRNKNK